MKDQLTLFGLCPLFGALGALATAVAWQVFAVTALELVPARLAVLSCLVAGLVGPVVVWAALWLVTRDHRTNGLASVLRRSASLGLGLVLAAEIGFYVPLGFLSVAFQ